MKSMIRQSIALLIAATLCLSPAAARASGSTDPPDTTTGEEQPAEHDQSLLRPVQTIRLRLMDADRFDESYEYEALRFREAMYAYHTSARSFYNRQQPDSDAYTGQLHAFILRATDFILWLHARSDRSSPVDDPDNGAAADRELDVDEWEEPLRSGRRTLTDLARRLHEDEDPDPDTLQQFWYQHLAIMRVAYEIQHTHALLGNIQTGTIREPVYELVDWTQFPNDFDPAGDMDGIIIEHMLGMLHDVMQIDATHFLIIYHLFANGYLDDADYVRGTATELQTSLSRYLDAAPERTAFAIAAADSEPDEQPAAAFATLSRHAEQQFAAIHASLNAKPATSTALDEAVFQLQRILDSIDWLEAYHLSGTFYRLEREQTP